MKKVKYAYASVCGHKHSLKNIPNQDAVKLYEGSDYIVISLADGHGGQPCFRSEKGAKIAVDAACEVLKEQFELINKKHSIVKKDDPNCEDLVIKYKKFAKNSLMELDKKWTKYVMNHLESNPFTESELADLSDDKKKQLENNSFLAYGTTVMGVLIIKDAVIFINIGDGSFLFKINGNDQIIYKSGSTVLGNETESLAMPEAYKESKVFIHSYEDLHSFLISTDGYVNSFKNQDGFSQVLSDLNKLCEEHGISEIKNVWEEWLSQTSKEGSGDDITACFVRLS